MKCIEFVSLQDLKGSIYFGGTYDKLREIKDIQWDILVIDEAHEGVDTYKTDIAFDQIARKCTLHLSGTPFKALATDKFADDAIYNWTYADEQAAKRNFVPENGEENLYKNLPTLNLYTYQMSQITEQEVRAGVSLDDGEYAYAFDLNEFFSVDKKGNFVHEDEVDEFLDALTRQEKFPFSTEELRGELKHTLWLLARVDSAKALARKLKIHPVFRDYEIVLATGDGKLFEDEETAKAFDRVTSAIAKHDKTITISVGQLTTGVTVPEWSGILMLSSIKSPASYVQTAFRCQNPCLYYSDGMHYRKENAYIFDFDPARTLTLYEEFANDLSEDTANGKGDSVKRKEHVKTLLNYFPVYAEDPSGRMTALDAEKVLSIPRQLKSTSVVNSGFLSDYLFANISNVFRAPQEVIDMISTMQPAAKESVHRKIPMDADTGKDLSINEEGDVELDENLVIGKSSGLFGDKIFDKEALDEHLDSVLEESASQESENQAEEEKHLDKIKEQLHKDINEEILDKASSEYGRDLDGKTKKNLNRKLKTQSDSRVDRIYGDFRVQSDSLEAERENRLSQAETASEQTKINEEYDQKQKDAAGDFKKKLSDSADELAQDAGIAVVTEVETKKRELKKKTIEDDVRAHLRGFCRTIPSFLMAYGDDGKKISLQNFDKIVPDDVFLEVTSITLDQFRFLRDGGDYVDKSTGSQEHFDGNLFDETVFNDSIHLFLQKKRELADYFDENQEEDIFDYIPPQRTNQIFTPKKVVVRMADLLEEENPGCFDDPDE